MPPMRIHRALARAGIASRRRAEELVAAGRVRVDGHVAQIGETVDPESSRITVDGGEVAAPSGDEAWIVLHKPPGFVTSRRDPQGRSTVFDLVSDRPGLTYVGRLDYLTEGVLLFTTDGAAAHRLTHPSSEVERTYVATVRGNAKVAALQARRGVELEDGPVYPCEAQSRPIGNRRSEFEVTLREGRTREVRRLCEALSLEVERLVRIRFGPVKLGTLPPGKTRPLTAKERRAIEAIAASQSR
ncbi:pseudouridine synthase [soil metagenome]